ncbi:MAG: response regulator, partial [Desulfamplus sp.]|nr:response regulator [Desulfamplus sp.]
LDRELVRDALEREHGGFHITEASNRNEFLEALDTDQFDAVLSDFNIAGFEGLQVIEIIKEHNPTIPVVIVTGTGSEEIAVQAMKKGASDYVIKTPNHILRLPHIILGAIEKKRLAMERERAYMLLAQSEERLKMAQEASNVGLWDWNMKTGEVYFNPLYYTMLGYEPYELPQSFATWSGLLHADDKDSVGSKIIEHLETKNFPFEYEFRLRKKSGDWLWVLGKGKVFQRDKNGKPLRATGTNTDIDYLKNIQARLHESNEKYWSILNSVEIGIALMSPQLEILEVNNKMKLWYPGIEDYDKPRCYQLAHNLNKTLPCDDCPVVLTFEDGKVHEVTREKEINNRQLMFREIASPVHDAQGKVTSAIRMIEDITEKRRVEKQLRQSQKMESLGTLASGISHDFNNILAAILGFAELSITDADEGSDLKEDLEQILNAGKRARDLVRRILSFSRQTEHNYMPIKVTPVFNESMELMRSVLPSNIQIISDIDPDAGTVMSDPAQLHQIIVNLCTNACHAMEEKGGILELSLKNISFDESIREKSPDLKPGDYLCLSVCDSGEGISADIIEKIFDPYFTTKEEGKGTGLGLSIVHGLVKSHGGHISVYTETNKGTCFHVYFPQVCEQSKKEDSHVKENAAPSGTESILIVDDEIAILKVQQRILERLGYRVTTVPSSVEALKKFAESPNIFDLIITDLTMPELTGDKLALSIKALRPDIPIILCTGFSKKIEGRSSLDSAIDEILTKPIGYQILARTVRKLLDRTK